MQQQRERQPEPAARRALGVPDVEMGEVRPLPRLHAGAELAHEEGGHRQPLLVLHAE